MCRDLWPDPARTAILAAAALIFGVSLMLTGPAAAGYLDWNWSAASDQAGTDFGTAVSTAGDLNGDGFSDLVLGEPLYDAGYVDNGRITIHWGSLDGLDGGTSPNYRSINNPGIHFGTSVCVAGDVNADGYDDVVVGAPYYDDITTANDVGRVYLYLGSASGLATSPAWITTGTAIAERIGQIVSTAGDVNGDGRDDVLICSPASAGHKIQLFLGTSTGLQSTPVWETNDYTGSGTTVAPAGDVNADGYDDFLVGDPNYPVSEGRAVLFLGNDKGQPSPPTWTATGGFQGNAFGSAVGMAGDVNGDGYGDVIVGDHDAWQNVGGSVVHMGRAVVYLGTSSGLNVSPAWETWGHADECTYGGSVGTAGDVNGDGFADVIVGDPRHGASPSILRGYVAVFLGAPNGPSTDPSFAREGPSANQYYGARVGTAGDADGDGFSDILVGCTSSPYGLVAVTYGGGLPTAFVPAWDEEGEDTGAQLGAALAAAGDVDGNGYDDIVVGSPGYGTGTGRVQVFMGPHQIGFTTWSRNGTTGSRFGAAVASAGDVNGDGYSDLLVGAPEASGTGRADLFLGSASGLGGSASWSASGTVAGEQFGAAVAGAGDVNGDGYADVIVGAPSYSNGELYEGRCVLYVGSATGPASTPAWTWESGHTYSNAGFAVAGVGDVNGDGYDDVLIGAPGDDTGAANRGRALLFLGSASGLAASPAWSAYGASALEQFGYAVGRAGDTNDDGFADVIIGAPYRTSGADYAGAAYVYWGAPSGLEGSPNWTVQGTTAYQYFGRSVAGAGDVDLSGDGDVLIGSPGTNEAYLYLDIFRTGGTTPDLVLVAQGVDPVSYGAAVAAAGDVNHDGFADLLVGAPGTDAGYIDAGAAYLHLGNNQETESVYLPNGLSQSWVSGQTIDVGGMTPPSNQFVLEMTGRSALGRTKVRLEYLLAPISYVTGPSDIVAGSWINTGSPVTGQGSTVGLSTIPAALGGSLPYKWCARAATRSPFFPRTPWFSMPRTQSSLASLRPYVAPPRPDLVVESLSPLSGSSGRITTISMVVRNQGTAAAQASVSSLTVDGSPVCDQIPIAALDPGARDTVSCQIGRLNAGGHPLIARADAGGAVAESDESNNTLSTTFVSYDVMLLSVAPDGHGDRPTIQAAVDDISSGGVIELQAGTFTGSGNRDVLVNAKSFTIRAGGDAVIDCQGTAATIRRAFEITNAGVGLTLDGVTVRNGWRGSGGGIYLHADARATIRNCLFEDNHATDSGAIHITSGATALVEDCTFRDNTADDAGGAGAIGSAGSIFRRCRFTGGYGHYAAGAFYFNGGSADFEDCLFLQNTSESWGGAIHVNNASAPVFTRCTFHANGSPQGGVYYARNGATATFECCILSASPEGAAAYCTSGGTLDAACCDVFGNVGGDYTGCLAGLSGVGGNLSVDPLFCDADGGDFHLQADSPCLPANNGCALTLGAFGAGCESQVGVPDPLLPVAFGLMAASPNPFVAGTTLTCLVPQASSVRLVVYSADGREIRELLSPEVLPPGAYPVRWDGRDAVGRPVRSGVYFVRFIAGTFTQTRKLVALP